MAKQGSDGKVRDVSEPKDSAMREPGLLRATEELTGQTAVQADRVADMILMFYGAGGTILGAIIAGFLYPRVHPMQPGNTDMWFTLLLVCVAIGGVIGFAIAIAFMGARGLLSWERRSL